MLACSVGLSIPLRGFEMTLFLNSRSALDMVAAIAQAHECILVSANEKHFAGIDVVNPIRGF